MNKIEELVAEVRSRLGISRFLGRRAITELRHHLHDSVADQLSRGLTRSDAEDNAVRQMGTPEELVSSVIDTSRGLRMVAFMKKHLLVTVAILAAPGVLLLGLSFLTFNFPCRDVTYESMGEMDTYRICGTTALNSLKPLISEPGFYGGPSWAKWTIHILTSIGPLFASFLIIQSQLSLRRRHDGESTVEIAFALNRTYMVALATTLAIFLTVVAYKAAG